MEDIKSVLTLRDIANIINGKDVTKILSQEGYEVMGIITGANLGLLENGKKWGLDLDGTRLFRKDQTYYPSEVKLYDILLTGRGTELHVARFSEEDEAERKASLYIADKNLFILRVKGEAARQKRISKILALFLSSEQGKAKLKSASRSTSKIQLSKENIGNIEIPVLSYDAQDDLWKQYKYAWRSFSEALNTFESKRKIFRGTLSEIGEKWFSNDALSPQ